MTAREIGRDQGTCKGCGRVLILVYYEDRTFESLHEAPLCAEYSARIASAKKPLAPSSVVLVDQAGKIHRGKS